MTKVSQDKLQEMIAEFQAGEVIADHLPFTFPSGFELRTVRPQCSCCQGEIRSQDFRGSWNQVLPNVVMIDGHGVCHHCRTISAFLFRVRADPQLVLETYLGQGQWNRCTGQIGILGRIKRQLKLLFTRR
ncbi:hypothetical protein ACQCLI_32115 (plasmid) [Pseudomonas nitroreducens]|uniref:hypothetical protein n=1 Tax=Pseudomonas nitroreducens TaxID=46680 RepID=UPI00037B9B65|nr:hypothetical protein [Pseudomonas nitroreducens]